jgi:hypothetical protein
MKHVTLSVMALAASVMLGSSADARPEHGVATRHSAGRSVQRSRAIHRGSAPRFNHRVGVRRTAFQPHGVRRPGVHPPGIHRPGVRRPGIHRPGIHRPQRVVVKHRPFVRPASYVKRYGKNYHLRYGKRFRHGWYYPGFRHRHWTRCVWIPRYRTYCYWDPSTTQYYYWCQPKNCYYPVTYCPTGSYNYEYSGPAEPAPSSDCDTCPVQQPVPAPPVSNSGCENCPVPQPVVAPPVSNPNCDDCSTQ